MYRFGSYEENSTTIMNLLFEQGVSRRNVSAFFNMLSDTFGVEVADFTVTQDLTSTESFEVAFHSFADAATFNASPNSAEILAAFKQMLATRFGVQVSDITLTVVDGSAKFQTAVETETSDVATAIQSDFGNPVELEKMFTTEMATAIDAQGVSGAALTNLNTFFFRGGDRSSPPEMLTPDLGLRGNPHHSNGFGGSRVHHHLLQVPGSPRRGHHHLSLQCDIPREW